MVENKEQTAFSLSGGALVCELSGEIDHHAARTVREAVDGELYRACPSELVLDFTRVGFMDSSGIAVVINTLRNMTRLEGKLILTGIREQPMKVFHTSGIDKLVEIKEDAI